MESALGWIGKLFEFLGSLFPRLLIVQATQLGVLFIRGKKVKPVGPGLWVYWPFWTVADVRAAVRQTENLPSQALLTLDGQTVVAGGMVRYEVVDARAALAETYDVDAAIADEALAVLCEFVTQKTLADIQRDRAKVNTELTRKIRSALSAYGVNVLRAQLTDFAPCVTLNHVGVKLGIVDGGE